jgi:hypothetical protein
MGRKILMVIAEAAEIDDLAQSRLGGGITERRRPPPVTIREVRGVEGVNKVIGGVATSHGVGQRGRFPDISPDGHTDSVVGRWPPCHRSDVMARFRQRGADVRTDETGGPGDEHTHRIKLPGVTG